jgi:hypothetical protein
VPSRISIYADPLLAEVGIEIAKQKQSLEEKHADSPDHVGAAKNRKESFRKDEFDLKQ